MLYCLNKKCKQSNLATIGDVRKNIGVWTSDVYGLLSNSMAVIETHWIFLFWSDSIQDYIHCTEMYYSARKLSMVAETFDVCGNFLLLHPNIKENDGDARSIYNMSMPGT